MTIDRASAFKKINTTPELDKQGKVKHSQESENNEQLLFGNEEQSSGRRIEYPENDSEQINLSDFKEEDTLQKNTSNINEEKIQPESTEKQVTNPKSKWGLTTALRKKYIENLNSTTVGTNTLTGINADNYEQADTADKTKNTGVSLPEDLDTSFTNFLKINKNEENGTYTIADVEGLICEDDFEVENLKLGDTYLFTKTDENGEKTIATFGYASQGIYFTYGNKQIVYNETLNKYTITEYDDKIGYTKVADDNQTRYIPKIENIQVKSKKQVRYSNSGKVRFWSNITCKTDKNTGDSVMYYDSSDGSYIQVSGKDKKGNDFELYFDKDRKYGFDSPKKAQHASNAIKMYKDAGIDELTPSQKLLLGDDNTLDTIIKEIKKDEDDDTADITIRKNLKLITRVKDLTENSTALETLSDEEKANLSEMMEYYDMIDGVYSTNNNLSEDENKNISGTLDDFKMYFNHVFNNGICNNNLNLDLLQQNLNAICNKLGIKRISDKKEGYEKGIKYTTEYSEINSKGKTYRVQETINTKTGSTEKTKTIFDKGLLSINKYENGKFTEKVNIKKDENGKVAEKTIFDNYHIVGVGKPKEETRKITVKYENGNPTEVILKNNNEKSKTYTIKKDGKIYNGNKIIDESSKLYQYIKINEEEIEELYKSTTNSQTYTKIQNTNNSYEQKPQITTSNKNYQNEPVLVVKRALTQGDNTKPAYNSEQTNNEKINDNDKKFSDSISSFAADVSDIAKAVKGMESLNFDGKIGTTFQHKIGNCWLLSGVNAIDYTKEGRKIISETLNHIKDKTGSYTLVDLKGYGLIRVDDFAVADAMDERCTEGHLYSTGDQDMIVFELAIEAVRKDIVDGNAAIRKNNSYYKYRDSWSITAANKSYSQSGFFSEIGYLITGKELECTHDIPTIENYLNEFNGKNIAIAVTFKEDKKTEDIYGDKIKLYDRHLYAIKKVKENSVIITNPTHSEEEIEIDKKTFLQNVEYIEKLDLLKDETQLVSREWKIDEKTGEKVFAFNKNSVEDGNTQTKEVEWVNKDGDVVYTEITTNI